MWSSLIADRSFDRVTCALVVASMTTKSEDALLGPTVKDRLIEYSLMIGLSPIWVPMWLGSTVALHCRLARYLLRRTESAWRRCVELWTVSQRVYGAEVGPNFDTPFEHSLTEYFAWYHPRSRAFVLQQLQNPNPYVAAYAFKCLIRYGPIDREDIPHDVFSRGEMIETFPFGCIGETLPLGQYISEYFETAQYEASATGDRR